MSNVLCSPPSSATLSQLLADERSKLAKIASKKVVIAAASEAVRTISSTRCAVLAFACQSKRRQALKAALDNLKRMEAELAVLNKSLSDLRSLIQDENSIVNAGTRRYRECLAALGVQQTNPTYRDKSGDSGWFSGPLLSGGISLKPLTWGLGALVGFAVLYIVFMVISAKSGGALLPRLLGKGGAL